MAIKNILLLYSGDAASDAALIAGIVMHKKYGAHLTALILPDPSTPSTRQKPWMPQDPQHPVVALEAGEIEDVHTRYGQLAGRHVSHDFLHSIRLSTAATLAIGDYARFFDVTLVGQFYNQPALLPDADPVTLAKSSARPVLVIPAGFQQKAYTNTALVAWNSKPAVIRAVFDGMDILQQRDHVTLLSIADRTLEQPPEVSMGETLQRHGVAHTHVELTRTGLISVEEVLLDYCKAQKPGLLIMGAESPSRFGTRNATGLTERLIRKTPVPLLLST
ncbi:MAG TPA: hypothetical protein DD979_03420 [Gammaproteobacteria bacterium]|jgi:nucleotide-binding universal stress UspA family protein|nr:hypothetical protein [Gammaproteobacteria bacterium]